MKKIGDSWRHHAFPFALQKFWKTGNEICWVDSSGQTVRKPFGRKTTGWLPNGHSVALDQPWGTGPNAIDGFNFESEFEYIDNIIPTILDDLLAKQPKKFKIIDAYRMFQAAMMKSDRPLKIGSDFSLPEDQHRNVVELLLSIVHRSLMQRRVFESFSVLGDPISQRSVGTSNMSTAFRRDKEIARNGPINNQHLLALFDPDGGFLFPDGLPNWIVMRANDSRIWGRLFVPLTPHLVVYFSTPEVTEKERSLTCLLIPASLRRQINEVSISFSENKSYFQGNRPHLDFIPPSERTQHFDPNIHPLFRLLDFVSGYREPATIKGLQQLLADYFLELGPSKSAGGEITLPAGFVKHAEFDAFRASIVTTEKKP